MQLQRGQVAGGSVQYAVVMYVRTTFQLVVRGGSRRRTLRAPVAALGHSLRIKQV